MTSTPQRTTEPAPSPENGAGSIWSRSLRAVLTRREILLVILLIAVLIWMTSLSYGGYLTGPYDPDYLAGSLVDAVPLAILALAELVVIVSGRGGIDLSIGAIVSLTGMVFGLAYGSWGWSLPVAVLLALVVGTVLGAVNGVLIAWLGFPALITTLATYYAYKSLAVVINAQKPISTPDIQSLYSLTGAVEIPLIGRNIPNVPLGVFTFLVPAVVLLWLLLQRTTYGRRLFAIGTNDVAATWAGVHVAGTRLRAYALAGLLAGVVAVYVTGQFASARPDAGTSGNGLALPAITIAVLGGVAITGGIGRVSGVLLAAVLITWLNAGILLLFEGNEGTQFQLLALGAVLVFCALLNAYTTRKYGGTR
ncbi:ABC transporter permease [Pseudonocardia spinosispora]|uniref:ABC transporter permease n=1 Tax=Pseudonocardia spinosispora TaxID=103441 RepID=UPI000424423B|nr:ABC transporter permease [Pseudonocardia spinosispora]